MIKSASHTNIERVYAIYLCLTRTARSERALIADRSEQTH
ncbi:hypothetical protein TREVI0001_1825 [Treponema vincentii ATCC 35580]|uniref:Uncharacterized protein n=1 Tax=Treponema vincentii ATCC 35580 TaxID=596324 RepID=C8PP82_9SPIR|nr:hypothetical protein TREVI0001_1825 [Treponema vincentii ATCC 35580]